MKHTLRVFLCWSLLPLLLLGLSGCFAKKATPEEILARYAGYTPLEEGENRAGIYVGEIDYRFEKIYIPIQSTSEILNQSQENAEATAARLQIYNAENPTRTLDAKIAVAQGQTTRSGTAAEEYYPTITIGKDVKADYALVYFTGIGKDDVEAIETPALFFLLHLNAADSALLTETPCLAGTFLEDRLVTNPPAK